MQVAEKTQSEKELVPTEEELLSQLPDMQLAQIRFELGCADGICKNKAEIKHLLTSPQTGAQ